MKRFILSVLSTLILTTSVYAATYSPTAQVGTVGGNLLTKNALPTVKFAVVDVEVSNSDILETKTLNINKTMLNYAGNDNETAAIVAHEMGTIVNSAASKQNLANAVSASMLSKITDEKLQNFASYTQQFAMNKMNAKDEMDADITGVDLMIKAGYNPLAMIVVLGKMEGTLAETLQCQPANFKRTMNIYDYLSYNYPETIKTGYACNEYRNFVAYIQPTIDKRNSNKSALAKFKKEQAKAKQERIKQLTKYKATGGANPWNVTQSLLNK